MSRVAGREAAIFPKWVSFRPAGTKDDGSDKSTSSKDVHPGRSKLPFGKNVSRKACSK